MPDVTVQRLTAESFFELGVPGVRSELIDGEVVRMGPAGGEHGIVAMRIGARLLDFVEANGLGVVCAAETGFLVRHDPDTVRAPDAAFVSRARLGGGRPPKKFWPFAPDLAVEVISPNDGSEAIRERVADWLAGGARAVWLVEPARGAVHVHRSPTDVRTFERGDVLTGDDILPGFTCPIADLFR
jgi:Uma2 family endonuclease